jgi:hypothetical protein
MKFAALCLAVAVLGGCATAPVVVRGDSYCRLSRKITWSKVDSSPTVHQIRVHNSKYRRVCG